LLAPVLNNNLIANLDLASITAQLHTMIAHIESMRELDNFTPREKELHWHDGFGSFRTPFSFAR
jgi:hypothetical protein